MTLFEPSDQEERVRDVLQIVPSKRKRVNTPTRNAVHRRPRPAHVEELAAEYQAGLTATSWRSSSRTNRETVSNLLEREGVPRRNRPLSPAQIKRATELYATGLSMVRVAQQLGWCDTSTVRLALLKAEVRTRDCQGRDR